MYDHEKGTKADLIRRAKRGDVKAFSGLYSEFERKLGDTEVQGESISEICFIWCREIQ